MQSYCLSKHTELNFEAIKKVDFIFTFAVHSRIDLVIDFSHSQMVRPKKKVLDSQATFCKNR